MMGTADRRLVVSRRLTKRRWGRLEVASMEDLVGEARDNFVSVVRAGAERREWRQRARLVQEEERRARKERERGRRRTNEEGALGETCLTSATRQSRTGTGFPAHDKYGRGNTGIPPAPSLPSHYLHPLLPIPTPCAHCPPARACPSRRRPGPSGSASLTASPPTLPLSPHSPPAKYFLTAEDAFPKRTSPSACSW